MDWETKAISTLVDIVKEQNEGFSGIFSQSLPSKCWSKDNKRIVLSSQVNHKMVNFKVIRFKIFNIKFFFFNILKRVLSCDIETKQVTVLDNLSDTNYCDVLDFNNDWICALLQGYNKKPKLVS